MNGHQPADTVARIYRYRHIWWHCATLALVWACFACRPPSSQLQASFLETGDVEITIDSATIATMDLVSEAEVRQFYASQQFRVAWVTPSGLLPAADSMIVMIRSAALYGLNPADYRLQELELLRSSATAFYLAPSDIIAACDVLLTDAFFTMANHLENGLLKPQPHYQPAATPRLAMPALLSRALYSNTVRQALESVEPCHPQYVALKQELQRLVLQGLTSEQAAATALLSQNMDRWRKEADVLPERYIMINIPAYTLYLVEGADTVIESRVIVGAHDTPTPELQSTIWCFTIYPYWNVPRSITVKEILPKVQADTSYLRRNFYDVLDARGNQQAVSTIDWSAYNEDNFPYYLRQREGEVNALGVIKFTFDNPYGVYLHDTNARGLFARSARALSHGCIRMEKARELAYYLVRGDKVYSNPATLEQYFELKKRTEVSVASPIPIYVRYLTAASVHGEIVYYQDIYGKDAMAKDLRALQ